MEATALREIVEQVVLEHFTLQGALVPIGVSNRHIHLTEADYKQLFPYEAIKVAKWLKQPKEFAAEQTVTVCGPKGEISKVRVLAPFRKQSQLEISQSDARTLGIKPPIRISGDIAQTPGIKLKTEHGEVDMEQGVIVAKRHIHLPTMMAGKLNLHQGDEVSVEIMSDIRPITLHACTIRVADGYELEMHIDTDEANAGNITSGTLAKIIQ